MWNLKLSLYKLSVSCQMMNLSEQISSLFICNVSPSEMPQLNIGTTKSEPLAIAVPMTIFYTIIFLFGVWKFYLFSKRKLKKNCSIKPKVIGDTVFLHCHLLNAVFIRSYSMVWAYWPCSWMLTWESVPFASTCWAWWYQVHTTAIHFMEEDQFWWY